MSLPRIPFNRPHLTGRELHYMAQSLASGKLSGDGEFTKRCSRLMEQLFGAYKVLLTTSCTSALEMAAVLLAGEKGSAGQVIMPGYTFVSTANAFVIHGFEPVFVDIRPDTLNLDEKKLEAAITPRTRAIVAMHYAGVGCEMDEIMAIARRHGVPVVEDAAQGVYAKYRDKYLGTIGDLGTYSFHDTKNYVCGEGGALVFSSSNHVARAEIVREKGTDRSKFLRGEVDKYTWIDVGASYLPADVLAAFLLAQLEQVEPIRARRGAIFARYAAGLAELEKAGRVRLPIIPAHSTPNYHMFYVLTDGLEQRTRLMAHLAERNIQAVSHYVALNTAPMGKKFSSPALPVVEATSDRLLRLPFFADLADAEVDRVVEAVREFYR